MRAFRNPAFDHGAALRVPPAHDVRNWRKLRLWLGEAGADAGETGVVTVDTPDGPQLARPGDWIVLSVGGRFHVACSAQRAAGDSHMSLD
jgi:hypothetical protein